MAIHINRVASEAAELGYATNVTFDDEELDLEDADPNFLWTCTCTINMVPEYHDLIRRQVQLNQLAQPLGAYIDGWGTFGNQEPK